MTTIRVSLRALKAALHVAGKQDVRYYLNGVFIEAGTNETRIIGCDGHSLAVMREEYANNVPAGEQLAFIVPRAVIEGVKVTPKQVRDDIVSIEVPADTRSEDCVMHAGQITQRFRAVDGRYPDYRRVIPAVDKASREPAAVNVDILAQMGKTIDVFMQSPKFPAIRLEMSGEDGVIVRTDSDRFVGVVMPLCKTPCESPIGWAQGGVMIPALKEAA